MIEAAAPNALLRRGWNKNSLPAGTEILVEGFQAKDQSKRANGSVITFTDGKKLFVGNAAAIPVLRPARRSSSEKHDWMWGGPSLLWFQVADIDGSSLLMPLEELYVALVLFGCMSCFERSQIATFAGLRVSLSRVEPVFAGFQLSNHFLFLSYLEAWSWAGAKES